jgi:hypothetical protein
MATPSPSAAPTPEIDRPEMDEPAPLRAVHTTNFPALLRGLGASLLVTTLPGRRYPDLINNDEKLMENRLRRRRERSPRFHRGSRNLRVPSASGFPPCQ